MQEQEEILVDYPMDTPEAKREVPFIEKWNGDIALKTKQDYHTAIHHYSKALFAA